VLLGISWVQKRIETSSPGAATFTQISNQRRRRKGRKYLGPDVASGCAHNGNENESRNTANDGQTEESLVLLSREVLSDPGFQIKSESVAPK
jgi:hypothetical protein